MSGEIGRYCQTNLAVATRGDRWYEGEKEERKKRAGDGWVLIAFRVGGRIHVFRGAEGGS